jgi:hypothetical protein
MDVKEAVAKAKSYVVDLFADEHVTNIGLEEVEHDDALGRWTVTLGFSRPWNTPATRAQEVLASLGGMSALKRSYKVITVANDGTVLSMKNPAQADIAE